MKKLLSVLLAVVTATSLLTTVSVAGELPGDTYAPIEITELITEPAELITKPDAETQASTLFESDTVIKVQKVGTWVKITIKTVCNSSVTKCGYNYLKLQRYTGGNWVDVSNGIYDASYANSNSKTFSDYVTTSSGYYYRAVGEHYAEKPRLIFWKTTETRYEISNTCYF